VSGFREQRTDDREQTAENRRQRTEDRKQIEVEKVRRSEDLEVRSRNAAFDKLRRGKVGKIGRRRLELRR
jgi:hypothetical protein